MYPFKNTFQSCTPYNKNLPRYHTVKLLNLILVGTEAAQYGLGYFLLVATHAKRCKNRWDREREKKWKGEKRWGMVMMNDWDYDEMPGMCQRQREKDKMRKEGQERGGW